MDADRFLLHQRRDRGLAKLTVVTKAGALARFYAFLIARYDSEIQAVTGYTLVQPIDEFNRPSRADYGARASSATRGGGRNPLHKLAQVLADTRKFLLAARDYLAASLWRRAGLRINETVMLDIRGLAARLGTRRGKLHIRYGKGSRGRGPKTRLVPTINSVDRLLEWWMTDVRHQFGDDWSDLTPRCFPVNDAC